MSFASEVVQAVQQPTVNGRYGWPRLGFGIWAHVGRDFAMLIGAALTIGVTAGIGMMLAVLALA